MDQGDYNNIIINVSHSDRWAKLVELNFSLRKTFPKMAKPGQAKSSSQSLDFPGAC